MYCGIADLDGCLAIELKDEEDDRVICCSLGVCDRCCDAARDERNNCLRNMMCVCRKVIDKYSEMIREIANVMCRWQKLCLK